MRAELKRWSDHEAAELLGRVPLFRGLPEAELWAIAALARPRSLDRDDTLFREGDPGEHFYIVFSGSVEVLKEKPLGDFERLAVKRAGDAFGEMSLLDDSGRSGTARALEPTELLSISRADFKALLGDSPLAIGLLRALARSLRSLDIRFTAQSGADSLVDGFTQFSRVVQHGLLPRHQPVVPGFDVGVAIARDNHTAGLTLWDVVPFDGHGALYAVLDVKGTGLPPGHLLALTRALLRQLADGPGGSAGRLMAELNGAMSDNLFAGLDECINAGFIALPPNGMPTVCLGGGQPAAIVRASGDVEELASHGPALGILPHFDFEEATAMMDPDDLLVVLSEVDLSLRRGAFALAADRRFESAGSLVRRLQTAMSRAKGLRDPEQDVAVVAVKKLTPDPKRETAIWKVELE